MNCNKCGKWAGAHATLPGQSKEHLCMCPPQRTWVGLTEEELNLIYAEPQTHIGQYARAIEAKLKQKNGYAEEKST